MHRADEVYGRPWGLDRLITAAASAHHHLIWVHLLESESHRSDVRSRLPLDTLNILLPNLYPEAAGDVRRVKRNGLVFFLVKETRAAALDFTGFWPSAY